MTAASTQRLADVTWSGFEASLDPAKLRTGGRWVPGVWEVYVLVRAGRIRRRRGSFLFSRLRPLRGVDLPAPDGVVAKATPTGSGGIVLDVRTKWTTIHGHRLDGEVLELTGEAHGSGNGKARLELIRSGDEKTFKFPLKPVGAGDGPSVEVAARMKLSKLLDAVHTEDADEDEPDEAEDGDEAEEPEDRQVWNLQAASGGARHTVGLSSDTPTTVWSGRDRELQLVAQPQGRRRPDRAGPAPGGARGIVDRRGSAARRGQPARGGRQAGPASDRAGAGRGPRVPVATTTRPPALSPPPSRPRISNRLPARARCRRADGASTPAPRGRATAAPRSPH